MVVQSNSPTTNNAHKTTTPTQRQHNRTTIKTTQNTIEHQSTIQYNTKPINNTITIQNQRYQHAELRISVYGRKPVEWDILASWVVANGLRSDNVVWLVQIPRLYNVYRDQGIIGDFEAMLENIFVPLFEATVDPESHPQLHVFLSQVRVGWCWVMGCGLLVLGLLVLGLLVWCWCGIIGGVDSPTKHTNQHTQTTQINTTKQSQQNHQ